MNKVVRYIKKLKQIRKIKRSKICDESFYTCLNHIYKSVLLQGMLSEIVIKVPHVPSFKYLSFDKDLQKYLSKKWRKRYEKMFGKIRKKDMEWAGISEDFFESILVKCGLEIKEEYIFEKETKYVLYGI